MESILQSITHLLKERVADKNLIIGISGSVATGKTRTCNQIKDYLETLSHLKVFYFPFDFWINYKNLNSQKYIKKFHIDDFHLAIKNINEGQAWLLPRYDLYKKGYHNSIVLGTGQIEWNNEILYEIINDKNDINYYRKSTDTVFTLQQAKEGIYIMEGTMIFCSNEIKNLYDLKVIVYATWEQRLARIFRRYNINETFGGNTQIETDFVQFLAKEALDCADEEIGNQYDESMIRYDNPGRTISSILDLLYLTEKISSYPDLAGVLGTNIEKIEQEVIKICNILKSSEGKNAMKCQIEFIQDNKHLIKIKNIDSIVAQLRMFL